MAGYRYKISLRITHPSESLEGMTAELGVAPLRTWAVGAPRTTPRGQPLKGIYRESYWTAQLADGVSADRDLAAALTGVLDKLSAKKDFLTNLTNSGGRLEFFIG
jgi:hypothetical protein